MSTQAVDFTHSPKKGKTMERMKFNSPRHDHILRDEMMDHPKYDRNKYRKSFQRRKYED